MKKGDVIARLPACAPSEEWCGVCSDDNIVMVIDIPVPAGAPDLCLPLCSACAGNMIGNIRDLNLGLN